MVWGFRSCGEECQSCVLSAMVLRQSSSGGKFIECTVRAKTTIVFNWNTLDTANKQDRNTDQESC